MHINLPATITQAKTEHQARSPHRHDQPARDLKPTAGPISLRSRNRAPRSRLSRVRTG